MKKEDSTAESIHKSVLLHEAIEGLGLRPESVVLDGTFGGGGHSREICERYHGIRIIAIDEDRGAWDRAREKFSGGKCKISFHTSNFRDIDEVLKKESVEKVNGVLLDLGLSSDQLEHSGRGFSFMKDEPLHMTMKENPSQEDLTAKDIVNTWSEENLADIIYGYGEERFARKIARGISEARKKKPIETTFDLVKVIEDSVPGSYRRGKIHPATRTFQAIRMAVNDELRTLTTGLQKGFAALGVGGKLAVISFHSLEDRAVKQFFKAKEAEGEGKILHKKPITAGPEEIAENPRARSAKLRILEKSK